MKIRSVLLALVAVFTLTLVGCGSYQKMLADYNAKYGGYTTTAADDPTLYERVMLVSGDYRYYVGTKYTTYPTAVGKAIITDYVGSEKDIVIPSEIGGYPVVAVVDIENKALNSVTFPGSVELIGDAFENCQLTSITISETGVPLNIVNSFNKNKITSMTLPARVGTVQQSFNENTVTKITFGGSELKVNMPFKNNLLYYSYLFNEKPGTYEKRGNLVYFNGQPTDAPAFLTGDPAVIIAGVDGDAKKDGGWLVSPGKHVVTVQYETVSTIGGKLMRVSVSPASLSADFKAGKQYIVRTTGIAQTGLGYFIEEMGL